MSTPRYAQISDLPPLDRPLADTDLMEIRTAAGQSAAIAGQTLRAFGVPPLSALGSTLVAGDSGAVEQASLYPVLFNHLAAGIAALTLEMTRE